MVTYAAIGIENVQGFGAIGRTAGTNAWLSRERSGIVGAVQAIPHAGEVAETIVPIGASSAPFITVGRHITGRHAWVNQEQSAIVGKRPAIVIPRESGEVQLAFVGKGDKARNVLLHCMTTKFPCR